MAIAATEYFPSKKLLISRFCEDIGWILKRCSGKVISTINAKNFLINFSKIDNSDIYRDQNRNITNNCSKSYYFGVNDNFYLQDYLKLGSSQQLLCFSSRNSIILDNIDSSDILLDIRSKQLKVFLHDENKPILSSIQGETKNIMFINYICGENSLGQRLFSFISLQSQGYAIKLQIMGQIRTGLEVQTSFLGSIN